MLLNILLNLIPGILGTRDGHRFQVLFNNESFCFTDNVYTVLKIVCFTSFLPLHCINCIQLSVSYIRRVFMYTNSERFSVNSLYIIHYIHFNPTDKTYPFNTLQPSRQNLSIIYTSTHQTKLIHYTHFNPADKTYSFYTLQPSRQNLSIISTST